MDLLALKHLAEAADWVLTLGKADVRAVRQDTETLLSELRKSLDSLYDVMKQIRDLSNGKVNRETVSNTLDYIQEFYLGNNDLSVARTRCSHIRRDTRRILFKLEHLVHSDLSKWREAPQKLEIMRNLDLELTDTYEGNLRELQDRLTEVRDLLDQGRTEDATASLRSLQASLKPQFDVLVGYLQKMDKAVRHVWDISG